MAFDLNFQPKDTGTTGMANSAPAQPMRERQTAEAPERRQASSDSVQISAVAAGRYAEERGSTQGAREVEEQLSGLQSSIEEIREGVGELRQRLQNRQDTARQDAASQEAQEDNSTAQTGQVAQQDYSAELVKIAEAASALQQQQNDIAKSGSDFSVDLDLSRLGATETDDGTTVTVADIATGGRADPAQDPELAARVATQTEKDLAAADTQVANYKAAMAQVGDIGGAEELLSADSAGALANTVTRNFSTYDPTVLYSAAAAGISEVRTLDLLA